MILNARRSALSGAVGTTGDSVQPWLREADPLRVHPVVPVLYAAETQEAAVAETLLHNIPASGGLLPYDDYSATGMVRLLVTRPLRLAVLHGLGLRRLRVAADQVTASPASTYPSTVLWAQAAHRSGFDGLVWMSRLCNDAKAYVFFGDRCEDCFEQDPSFGRVFGAWTGIRRRSGANVAHRSMRSAACGTCSRPIELPQRRLDSGCFEHA